MPDEPRVLIIDDEEAARYGFWRALEKEGYQLAEAQDGLSALEKVREFQPDVIISDVNMPGMDGISLLKEVAGRPGSPLVVMVTGYGSEDIAIQALRAGAYDYVSKPYDVDDFRASIRRAVTQQRLLRENRQYYEALERTLAELRESQASLVQAEKMASLGRWVGVIAHEVNNPLGILKSSTDLMGRAAKRMSEECQRMGSEAANPLKDMIGLLENMAGQSQAACDRIGAFVVSLKQFAQLDRADFQPNHVNTGIQATLRMLEHELASDVEVETDLGELPAIECDLRRLNQLFLNLLLNSVEAMRGAGRAGKIRVRTSREGEWIRVDIIDGGPAIPPEHLARVFDPLFVVQGGRVGGGLRLPICYQIASSHGGRIEVAGSPDGGNQWTVLLPVARST